MRFSDITGRENIKKQFCEQVESRRMPHALLLWGNEGTDKLSFARALAQYIHCPNRKDGDSCGVCPVCIQHRNLNYPDMIYAFPVPVAKGGKISVSGDYMAQWSEFLAKYPQASWQRWLELCEAENSQPVIRVDESAAIQHRLNLGNYGDSIKILLIWLPEKMNVAAANKLLKLIEEPQPGRMFIMVSNNPAQILPTVYSRLQRVKIEPPAIEETAAWLKDKGYPSEIAVHISEVAGGNQLRAIELLDKNGEDAEFRDLFHEVMRRAYIRDVKALRIWSEKTASLKREKIKRFMRYMTAQLRLNYLYDLRDSKLTPMLDIDREFSQRFAPYIHGNNVEEIMRECDEAIRDISGNGNAKIILFDFALRMIMLIKKQFKEIETK